MRKKVLIPVVITAVVILGGLGYKAYAENGFGSSVVYGYQTIQNGIVNGYTNFQDNIVEKATNFIDHFSDAQ